MCQSEKPSKAFWFPTTQERGDETQHIPMQKRILHGLKTSPKLKQLNPQNSRESHDQFLSHFDGLNQHWTKSISKH